MKSQGTGGGTAKDNNFETFMASVQNQIEGNIQQPRNLKMGQTSTSMLSQGQMQPQYTTKINVNSNKDYVGKSSTKKASPKLANIKNSFATSFVKQSENNSSYGVVDYPHVNNLSIKATQLNNCLATLQSSQKALIVVPAENASYESRQQNLRKKNAQTLGIKQNFRVGQPRKQPAQHEPDIYNLFVQSKHLSPQESQTLSSKVLIAQRVATQDHTNTMEQSQQVKVLETEVTLIPHLKKDDGNSINITTILDDIDDSAVILKNPLRYVARTAQSVVNVKSNVMASSEDDDQSVLTANLMQHRLQQNGSSFTNEENSPNRPQVIKFHDQDPKSVSKNNIYSNIAMSPTLSLSTTDNKKRFNRPQTALNRGGGYLLPVQPPIDQLVAPYEQHRPGDGRITIQNLQQMTGDTVSNNKGSQSTHTFQKHKPFMFVENQEETQNLQVIIPRTVRVDKSNMKNNSHSKQAPPDSNVFSVKTLDTSTKYQHQNYSSTRPVTRQKGSQGAENDILNSSNFAIIDSIAKRQRPHTSMMHKKDYYNSGAASSTNISYYHNKHQSNELAVVPFMNSKINESSNQLLKRPESSSQFYSILHHQNNYQSEDFIDAIVNPNLTRRKYTEVGGRSEHKVNNNANSLRNILLTGAKQNPNHHQQSLGQLAPQAQSTQHNRKHTAALQNFNTSSAEDLNLLNGLRVEVRPQTAHQAHQKVKKGLKTTFVRADMRHSERIHIREKGNSFYQNPIIQAKKQSAQQVRDFKEKAQEHRKVINGITMREIKRIQQGGLVPQLEAMLAIGQSSPERRSMSPARMLKKSSKKLIDPELTNFEQVLNKSLKKLEVTKNQVFGKEPGDLAKQQDDYFFQRMDYMKHNKEYRDSMHEFEHKPITEEELQPNLLKSVTSSMFDNKHNSSSSAMIQSISMEQDLSKNPYMRNFKHIKEDIENGKRFTDPSTAGIYPLQVQMETGSQDIEKNEEQYSLSLKQQNSSTIMSIYDSSQQVIQSSSMAHLVLPSRIDHSLKQHVEAAQKQEHHHSTYTSMFNQLKGQLPHFMEEQIDLYSKKYLLKRLDLFSLSKTIPQQRNAMEREKAIMFIAKTMGVQIKNVDGSVPFLVRQMCHKLAEQYSVVKYESGSRIVNIGDRVDAYMVVVKGSVTQLNNNPYPAIQEESNNSIFMYKHDSSPPTYDSSDKMQKSQRLYKKKQVLFATELSQNPSKPFISTCKLVAKEPNTQIFSIKIEEVIETIQTVKNEQRFANMTLLQSLKQDGAHITLFKKWNKDKLMTFYNHPDFKLKLYLKEFYDFNDLTMIDQDSFYIIKEGDVQLESLFDMEFICKVPLAEGKTEWNIHSQKRQGLIGLRKERDWFGFEELILGYSDHHHSQPSYLQGTASSMLEMELPNRGRRAFAMTDCYVLEGKLSILTEYLNKNELLSLVESAEKADGSKVGEAYLQGRREKKNRLKQFLDAAQFNVVPDYIGQHDRKQKSTCSQPKKKQFTLSTGHDLFKNRKNSKMLTWAQSIKDRDQSTVEGDQQKAVTQTMQNPPRVVERRRKKMVTNAHFMNDKQIKDEPYLVGGGAGKNTEDSGDVERSRSLSSIGQISKQKSMKLQKGLSLKLKHRD